MSLGRAGGIKGTRGTSTGYRAGDLGGKGRLPLMFVTMIWQLQLYRPDLFAHLFWRIDNLIKDLEQWAQRKRWERRNGIANELAQHLALRHSQNAHRRQCEQHHFAGLAIGAAHDHDWISDTDVRTSMNWRNVPVLRIVIREMPKRALLFFGESEDRRSYRWEPARKVAPIPVIDR